jgi:hypothetical protein
MILIRCENCGLQKPAYKFKKPSIFYSEYLFKYRGIGYGICKQCETKNNLKGHFNDYS